MRWKIFALIAGLILMVTTVAPPSKVEAQGLVEKALNLVLVAVGPKEAVEIYLRLSNPPQGQSAPGGNIRNAFLYQPRRVSPLDSSSDGPCTETVQSTVNAYPGLNILDIRMGEGNESLLVNGEDVPLSKSCWMGADRVAIQVSVPIPPSMVERLPADPNTVPVGFNRPVVVGGSIYNLTTRETVTSWVTLQENNAIAILDIDTSD
jgi:hypothetical protein